MSNGVKKSLPGIYHLEHINKRAKLFPNVLETITGTWKICINISKVDGKGMVPDKEQWP